MDCVIPPHGVRTFSAAVACLGKVGKELYVDFDPFVGLTLRTLNDAKSAYAAFRFAPSFFERCAAPPPPPPGSGARVAVGRRGRGTSLAEAAGRKRDRSRSGSRTRRRRRRRPDREEGGRGGEGRSGVDEDVNGEEGEDENENEEEEDGRYMCRVPVRNIHAVLRPRKGVVSLRVRSKGGDESSFATPSSSSQTSRGVGDDDGDDEDGPLMQLSFEFRVENAKTGGMMKLVHRVGVADADGVAAVASRDGCSEIVSGPGVLLRMLEPLKRTAEVALTVDDEAKVVTATSFHHGDAVAAAAGSADNALLNAASAAVLKTETSIGIDEFDEYNFKDDRADDGNGANAGDDECEAGGASGAAPSGVNEEVTLVFGIKETKAMLQFCAQADPDEEIRAVVSFHWGGRPVSFDAEGESFTAQLIMATLDHKLLGRGSKERRRRS